MTLRIKKKHHQKAQIGVVQDRILMFSNLVEFLGNCIHFIMNLGSTTVVYLKSEEEKSKSYFGAFETQSSQKTDMEESVKSNFSRSQRADRLLLLPVVSHSHRLSSAFKLMQEASIEIIPTAQEINPIPDTKWNLGKDAADIVQSNAVNVRRAFHLML